MLESLEGKRGVVRAKPPIPALEGLFGKPTVVNNVLTLARGADDPGQRRRGVRATSASAARAAPRSSSSPATSSRAASSRRPSASPCASSSRTTAAARCPAARSAPCRSAARSAPTCRRPSFDLPMDYEAFAESARCSATAASWSSTTPSTWPRQARFAMEFCADRVVRQVHAVPHRVGARRRGDRPDHRRRRTCAANLVLLDDLCETMTDGLAVRHGRADPDAGAERAQALPRGLRPPGDVPSGRMTRRSRHP